MKRTDLNVKGSNGAKRSYLSPELELIAMENQGVIASSLPGVGDDGDAAENILPSYRPSVPSTEPEGLDDTLKA